jgi:hypothetical protein
VEECKPLIAADSPLMSNESTKMVDPASVEDGAVPGMAKMEHPGRVLSQATRCIVASTLSLV